MAELTIPFVDDSNFEKEVMRSFEPVFVIFLDSRDIRPLSTTYVQHVQAVYDGTFKGVKVDVDKYPEIYSRYAEHYMNRQPPPCLALFKYGAVKELRQGVVHVGDVQAMLDKCKYA